MGEAEDEFIYNAVNGNRPANKLKTGVGGVVEDEIMSIEIAQWTAAHAARKLAQISVCL